MKGEISNEQWQALNKATDRINSEREQPKWTKEDIETNIKTNLGCDYGMAIVAGALFYKIYGEYPKLGLSGHQASAIDSVVAVLPDSFKEEK